MNVHHEQPTTPSRNQLVRGLGAGRTSKGTLPRMRQQGIAAEMNSAAMDCGRNEFGRQRARVYASL